MYIDLSDTINLGSKLTFKRLINAYRIYQSYQVRRQTESTKIGGLPISLSVEPTTACNLKCPECISGLRSFTRATGRMELPLFKKLVEDVSDTLLYMTFYFQGEPYLNPELVEMIRYASERKIYTATSTNGHFLDDQSAIATIESGLDRLIISVDGATQQTYEAYRKQGDLSKVIEGTRNILRWRKKLKSTTPKVVWQFLVVRPNEHEIEVIRKQAKDLGVDKIAFKTAQIQNFANGDPLIPTINKFSRYKKNAAGGYLLKNRMDNECWKMWHSGVVTWDGQVVPCCFDKDANHKLGSLNTNSFGNIWFSESYNQFRNMLFSSRDQIEMCKNCSEGTKIWG